MSEVIKEKISRWSLERIRFVLGHLEDFIDDESKSMQERAKEFVPAEGIEQVQRLLESLPSEADLPARIMDRLAPFFDAGLLIKRGPNAEQSSWWVTDINWRGLTFHMELQDQIQASSLVPELTPLQIHRAPAVSVLKTLNLPLLIKNSEAQAYLLKPTPSVAFVFFTPMADHWAQDHMAHAQRLINKCFIY